MIALMKAGARRPIASLFAGPLLVGVTAPACSQNRAVQAPPLPAAVTTKPRAGLQIIAVPTPLPLPGQLKPIRASRSLQTSADPKERVKHANSAARVEPDRVSWLNAIQQPGTADGLRKNPLGIFVDAFNWSKELSQ